MNSSAYLCYPNLDLFLYQLRDGLGETEEQIVENHTQFWANLPPEILVDLELESRADNSNYIRLLELTQGRGNSIYPLRTDSATEYQIGGYYYPVLLSDTYGLLLDCCVKNQHSIQLVDCLQYLKKIITSKRGNLGKTWMISGWLPPGIHINPETLAEKAYETTFPDREWQHVHSGKFLGADIFEVWNLPQPWQTTEDNSPVLMILYPNLETMDSEGAKYNDSWLRLFCYRHKILWSYREARYYTDILQKQLSFIQETLQIINQSKLDLRTSKQNLKAFSSYVINLRQLEILSSMIQANLYNYKQQLSNLITRSSKVGDTDLKFLEEFSELVTLHYQKQIQQEQANFQAGLRILENLRDTVRGIVEIEQAERDQRIADTIAIFGIGVGTASVVATTVSPLIAELTQSSSANPSALPPLTNPWLKLSITLSASIILGILASLITWSILPIMQRSRRPPKPPK